jgi:4-diphosphocytidyl-2-C-methyl-D-erythritol kinase
VNLSLFLGPTREDGRHELVTVFESVSLCDTLTLTVGDAGHDQVHCPGVEGPNLVDAALAGLRAAGWTAPPVAIEIEKRIPVAAGMGGGSADAAAALRLAQAVTGVDSQVLWSLAAGLGADVPGQVTPGVSLGTGAGERVEQAAPLAAHALAVVPLPAALSTPAVFREADRMGLPRSGEELSGRLLELSGWLRRGVRLPDHLLVNDLEPAARSLYPPIERALTALLDAGAAVSFVCGSGPTCAGLWWGSEALAAAGEATLALAARYPMATAVTPVGSEAGDVRRATPSGSSGTMGGADE